MRQDRRRQVAGNLVLPHCYSPRPSGAGVPKPRDVHQFDRDPAQDEPQAGPSWASARWPVTDAGAGDELTRALDPMALKLEIAKAAPKNAPKLDEAALEQAAQDRILSDVNAPADADTRKAALVANALALSVRSEIRRRKKT
eukprot:gene3689-3737_t